MSITEEELESLLSSLTKPQNAPHAASPPGNKPSAPGLEKILENLMEKTPPNQKSGGLTFKLKIFLFFKKHWKLTLFSFILINLAVGFSSGFYLGNRQARESASQLKIEDLDARFSSLLLKIKAIYDQSHPSTPKAEVIQPLPKPASDTIR